MTFFRSTIPCLCAAWFATLLGSGPLAASTPPQPGARGGQDAPLTLTLPAAGNAPQASAPDSAGLPFLTPASSENPKSPAQHPPASLFSVSTSTAAASPQTLPSPTAQAPAGFLVTPSPQPAQATPTPAPAVHQPPAGKDPGFHVALDSDNVHIGDPVTLRLEATDPAVTPDRITGAQFEPDPEKWHVDTPFRRDASNKVNKTPETWVAVVRPFDTGALPLPPFKVIYRDAAGQPAEAATTTATLHVLALRPAGNKETTLLGLRDPADIPRDWTWLWTTLAVLAALGLLGWQATRWWLRHRRAAFGPPEPDLPPGIWALRELDHRARLPVCQNGPAKAIFSHVSEVIRLYLGRRYGVTAIDMTTHECLQSLSALHLGDEVLRWMREFLEECDLVKFTTYEPSRERWKTIWHDARLIIKMTTPPDELGEGAGGAQPREALAVK